MCIINFQLIGLYKTINFFILIIILISLILIIISFILPLNFNFKKEKPSTFESGLENLPSRNIFSLRFFLVSIIFLIFDTEIIVLISTPISLFKINGLEILITFTFLTIIILSLLLE